MLHYFIYCFVKCDSAQMSIQGVTKIGSTKGHQLVHSYADDGGFVIQWNPSIKSASFVELFEKMNSDLGSPPDFVSSPTLSRALLLKCSAFVSLSNLSNECSTKMRKTYMCIFETILQLAVWWWTR